MDLKKKNLIENTLKQTNKLQFFTRFLFLFVEKPTFESRENTTVRAAVPISRIHVTDGVHDKREMNGRRRRKSVSWLNSVEFHHR